VRKPRDKAKAEAGVLLVERWILAVLRHRTFFSLPELNREIARLLERLNTRPFKKLPGTRRELFEKLDRLVHSAYRIKLRGESMRKRRATLTTTARSQ
jgi:hypothetical protein